MYSKKEQVLLGVRVPLALKKRLSQYCNAHGLKLNYVVAEAINDKLVEFLEDRRDADIARQRLQTAEFVSQEELGRYLRKRGVSGLGI